MKHPKKQMTILMSGGGTAGHIVPLLTLARELKQKQAGCRLVYVGQRNEKFADNLKIFDSTYSIKAGKLRRWPVNPKTLLLNFRDIFFVVGGFFQALSIIKKERPSVFFSKGSFVAVPLILASRFKKVPIVTHDSDAVAGLANRLAKNWAVWHATGLPVDLYDYPKQLCRYVGVPLDKSVFEPLSSGALAELKASTRIDSSATVLLVIGGSLGAATINQKFPQLAPSLMDKYKDLVIIHITGAKYLDDVKEAYGERVLSSQRVRLYSYTNQLTNFMRLANLVISRAGATTLAELAALAKPSLVLPSPYLANGHQLKNAQWYKARGAVEVMDDSASSQQLANTVGRLLGNPAHLDSLSMAIANTAKPKAVVELAQLIMESAGSSDV